MAREGPSEIFSCNLDEGLGYLNDEEQGRQHHLMMEYHLQSLAQVVVHCAQDLYLFMVFYQ